MTGVPDWVPRKLFPFESHFREIAGCRVHYVDEGKGPVLLFLHGNPTWSFLYRDIIQSLRGEFRCVALDYPGFGLSRAARGYDFRPETHAGIVGQFVKDLGLESITMMVQDWGGPIGFSVATTMPERFKAFVIGNTWAWSVKGDPHYEKFSGLMGGPIGRFFILNFNAFVNVLIPRGTALQKPTPEVMRAYRGPFPTRASREPTAIFPREIIASSDFLSRVSAQLSALADRPALLLWGDQDAAFKEPQRRRFETIFPHHKTHILRGASHFIQEDAPDEIVREIKTWFAEIEGTR